MDIVPARIQIQYAQRVIKTWRGACQRKEEYQNEKNIIDHNLLGNFNITGYVPDDVDEGPKNPETKGAVNGYHEGTANENPEYENTQDARYGHSSSRASA